MRTKRYFSRLLLVAAMTRCLPLSLCSSRQHVYPETRTRARYQLSSPSPSPLSHDSPAPSRVVVLLRPQDNESKDLCSQATPEEHMKLVNLEHTVLKPSLFDSVDNTTTHNTSSLIASFEPKNMESLPLKDLTSTLEDENVAVSFPTNKLDTLLDDPTDITVSVVTWNLAEESPPEEQATFIRRFRQFGDERGNGSDLVLISAKNVKISNHVGPRVGVLVNSADS
jgi:hypothetical protein